MFKDAVAWSQGREEQLSQPEGHGSVRKEVRVAMKPPHSVQDQRHEHKGPADLDLSLALPFPCGRSRPL